MPLSFPFLPSLILWHVVCGGCQVPAAIGMMRPQDGEVLLLEWDSLYMYFFISPVLLDVIVHILALA